MRAGDVEYLLAGVLFGNGRDFDGDIDGVVFRKFEDRLWR